MNVASKTNPIQSARLPCARSARAVTARADARLAKAADMSRTLSQKITRQLVTWVSAPPSSGPMLKPSIRNPVQAPIAAPRRSDWRLDRVPDAGLQHRAAARRRAHPRHKLARNLLAQR